MVFHYFALYSFKVFCQFQYQCTKVVVECTDSLGLRMWSRWDVCPFAWCEPQRSTRPRHHTDLSVKAIHIPCTSLGISYARYAYPSFFSCTTPRLLARLGNKKCHTRTPPNSVARRFPMRSGPQQQFSATYFITIQASSYKESIFTFQPSECIWRGIYVPARWSGEKILGE